MFKSLKIDSYIKKRILAGGIFICISAILGVLIFFLAVYDPSVMYIRSSSELEEIVKDGVLTPPEKIKTLKLRGNFTAGPLTVEKPLSISISGNVVISGKITYNISGETEDAVTIDTSRNSDSLVGSIAFEAPYVSLIWNGDSAPSYEYVQRYLNVRYYNQYPTDSLTGGPGKCRLVSCTLTDSSGMAASFTVDGNFAVAALGYASLIDLDSSKAEAELSEDGSCRLVSENGGYYLMVKDSESRERGYRVLVTQPEYTLPVIYITTENEEAVTSKEEYIGGTFSIDYNGLEGYEWLKDVSIKIRGRGNSSWKLDKKPYKIKFDKKTSLFGLTPAKDWVLQANHVDKSLMRNNLAMSICTLLDNMVFVPHSFMVDVFFNGSYQGVYSLTEQVEVKKGRIEAEEDSTDVNTDYFIEIGGESKKTSFGVSTFKTELIPFLTEIKSPDAEILTPEQYTYIKKYFTDIDKAIISGGDYEEYLDMPSLVDWFIINELSYNTDCTMRRSVFLLKRKDGKLYMATPWDFDYAFGNMSWDSENFEEWICCGNDITRANDDYVKTNWYTYLLEDDSFKAALKERWNEVKEAIYKKAMETIDSNLLNIGLSAKENFTVWPEILGAKLQFENKKTAAIDTYEGQVEYLKEYIDKRFGWMDETINAM